MKRWNVLLEYIHYPVCSGRWIRRALDDMEWSARSIGKCTGNDLWGMQFDNVHLPRLPEPDWTPDVIIVTDGNQEVLRNRNLEEKYPDTPIVVWGLDNAIFEYNYKQEQRRVDHYFWAHRWPCAFPFSDDEWLPVGFAPHLFSPSPIPWAERAHDCAFAGQMYWGRQILQHRIYRARPIITADFCMATPEVMARVYHNARVSLNWSGAADLSQRVFETLATGNRIVSDEMPDWYDVMSRWGGEAEDHVVFTQPSRLENTVRWAAHSSTAIEAPTEWLKNHTWEARLRSMFDTLLGKSLIDSGNAEIDTRQASSPMLE